MGWISHPLLEYKSQWRSASPPPYLCWSIRIVLAAETKIRERAVGRRLAFRDYYWFPPHQLLGTFLPRSIAHLCPTITSPLQPFQRPELRCFVPGVCSCVRSTQPEYITRCKLPLIREEFTVEIWGQVGILILHPELAGRSKGALRVRGSWIKCILYLTERELKLISFPVS